MNILFLIYTALVIGLIITIYLIIKNLDIVKIFLNFWLDKLFGK